MRQAAIKIAPSLLSADFARLGHQVVEAAAEGGQGVEDRRQEIKNATRRITHGPELRPSPVAISVYQKQENCQPLLTLPTEIIAAPQKYV